MGVRHGEENMALTAEDTETDREHLKLPSRDGSLRGRELGSGRMQE
jgi:hypothetical protein